MLILKSFEPYLFLLPSIIILFVFLFVPLIWNIYISLHDVSILTIIKEWNFVGFKNFDNSFGIINYGIEKLGLESIGWFSDPNLAIWIVIVANTWYGAPFTILFLTAGLLSINPTLYEAAIIDGATKFRRFFYITLPLLKSFILTNLILVTVWTINFFDLQLIMTNGGPLSSTTTMSLYMYKQAFEFGYFSEGAAVGILLIIMNIAIAFVYLKLFDVRNKKT